MTNPIAIFLAAAVLAFFAVDHFVMEWDMTVFLGKKFLDLIEYLKFWR